VNHDRILRTARLTLCPVSGADLPDLLALKADPRVFAVMLGGVRNPAQVQEELAEDIMFWGANSLGIWSVKEAGAFQGIVGFHNRSDGRGLGLRFAFWPEARGRGVAREAAGAALRYAHDRVGIVRAVAVVRDENIASRTVLGAIGMVECGAFEREGFRMLVYETPPSRLDPFQGHSISPA
jgi:RimJ/RimL family protein N-acetyltransferase